MNHKQNAKKQKTMKKIIFYTLILITITTVKAQQSHRYDPPWNTPPNASIHFTIPGINNVPDLFGDIENPQLVVFFAGNQFMCIDELINGFKKKYPQYDRVFAETLPPGILAKQIEGGSLTIGNLRITHKPDVYTAGKGRITQMKDYFDRTEVYAYNKLALMVPKGNPKHIKKIKDLGQPALRVSMPNPAWEGIGKQIEAAYLKAGGQALHQTIMQIKVNDSSTYLTRIHHRESPMRILYGQSDVAPVWYSEAHYQQLIGHPIDMIEIPKEQNIRATYMAGKLKQAPHPEAATDFMNYLSSQEAKLIYRKYGFETE